MNRYSKIANRLVVSISDVWKQGVGRDMEKVFSRGDPIDFWEYSAYLTFTEGTSNKFHYFGVIQITKPDGTKEFVGGNAYGRIGGTAKIIEIARGGRSQVVSVVQRKENEKIAKGYRERGM